MKATLLLLGIFFALTQLGCATTCGAGMVQTGTHWEAFKGFDTPTCQPIASMEASATDGGR